MNKLQDLYKSIKGDDYRSINVDQNESGVYLSIHVVGGYASIALSRDAAIELKNAIQAIIGDKG